MILPVLFRFDKTRPNQDRMIHDINKALSAKSSLLINAPTGIGKTDAAISSILEFAIKNGLKAFFLTPKISQHKIAVESLQGIREKFALDISYIDMVGKRNLCINTKVNYIEGESFYRSCESLVKAKKCQFYTKAKEKGAFEKVKNDSYLGHNRFFDSCFDKGICAYEAASDIAKDSMFIIADYSHVLNPYTRASFFKRIGARMENSIIIWDEAHNIISAASSYLSANLSTYSIASAKKELAEMESNIDITYLDFILESIAGKRITNASTGEAYFDKNDIDSFMPSGIEEIVEQLEKTGLEYITKTESKRSSLSHISRFLSALYESDDSCARIVSRKGRDIKLSIIALYPKEPLSVLKEAYSNIFMSGTLLPLNMYRELFDVKTADTVNYASPFPKSNRLCLIDADVSTKYEDRSPDSYKKIAKKICAVKGKVNGNVAVFFPSFDVLDSVYRYMERQVEYIQRRDMRTHAVETMIRGFKSADDSLLFAVMGGSFSEGIDYSNNVIKGIIIVGIPLERPNLELNSRIEYMNKLFNGKGSEYAYIIPGIIRVAQAAGRAIRSESDRAFILLMDKRYDWNMYKSLISNFINISKSSDNLTEIAKFLNQNSRVKSDQSTISSSPEGSSLTV